jgi:NTE family protein
MTTAFVLSGGGSLGAVQVGMLKAVQEHGFRPDLLVGTSAGALNAAYVAANGFDVAVISDLATIWRGLRRADVFPFDPVRQGLAITGRRHSLCSRRPLRRLVESNLTIKDLETARIPVHIVATDVMSGQELLLSTGEVASAVLASAAIPAVFAPVERNGRSLMDGGVANNTAVSHAIELGADRVVVLPAGFSCALGAPPATPLAAATHAITLLIEQRLVVDVAHLAPRADIIVLPPLCPLSVSPADFRFADELMSRTAQQPRGSTPATTCFHTPNGSSRCTGTGGRSHSLITNRRLHDQSEDVRHRRSQPRRRESRGNTARGGLRRSDHAHWRGTRSPLRTTAALQGVPTRRVSRRRRVRACRDLLP